jgi:DNA-binding transcriptional LysR family regulator
MNKKRLPEHLEKLNTFKVVVAQPAVSRTIKVLEDVLECRLIERESHGIRLTTDGTRLYECAKVIEKTLESFNVSDD